jgi:tyrosyl-tRNA synthetase
MFAKLLSISDELMWRYYTLLFGPQRAEIGGAAAEVAAGRNPKDAKVLLARRSPRASTARRRPRRRTADFQRRASGGMPDDMPEVALAGAPMAIGALLKQAGLAPSTSEALRLVEQGGVRIDGAVVSDKA